MFDSIIFELWASAFRHKENLSKSSVRAMLSMSKL